MTVEMISLPTPQFPLEILRPHNKDLCSDKQFQKFVKHLRYVLAGNKCRNDVQRNIVDLLTMHFDPKTNRGSTTFDDLIGNLSVIAECGMKFGGRSMAKGKLIHTWIPDVHGWHPWLDQFECLLRTENIFDNDMTVTYEPEMFMTGTSLQRISLLEEWANASIKAAQSHWEAYAGKQKNLPEASMSIEHFPARLILKVTNADRKGDVVTYTITPEKEGKFTLTMEWATANRRVSHWLGIPHRMAESNRLDERQAFDVETNKPLPPLPHTLQLKLTSTR